MKQFIHSTEDCLIIRSLATTTSLREAANQLSCDPSGLLRKVQRLAEQKIPPVEKINGKWHVTNRGQQLLLWTEEAIRLQSTLLNDKFNLNIASTSWFAERKLIPHINKLKISKHDLGNVYLLTPEESFEKSLLSLEADFVIACHPPENPSIAHKRVFNEEWISVAPAKWKSKIPKLESKLVQYLSTKEYLRHKKVNPLALYPSFYSIKESKFIFNQLTGIRSALINGYGWSCIPKILIEEEINRKKLIELNLQPSISNTLCIWWLRERSDISTISTEVFKWLKSI